MTYPQQQPPVMHGYSPTPPNGDWQPPAPKKRGPLPWLIGALALLTAVSIGLGVLLLNRGDGTGSATPVATVGATTGDAATTDPTPEPPYPTYAPVPKDFKLTPKITDKQCFGSAGCNVTFRVEVEYRGPQALETNQTWLVVYEINGIEDGPAVGNIEVTGTEGSGQEEDVQTTSSKAKITLKVTSVEQG